MEQPTQPIEVKKAKKPKRTIRDFTWKHGVQCALVFAAVIGTVSYASARYTIGLDTQEFRCLDEWIYLIDRWAVPTADDVQRNDYVAIILTADQTPENARWHSGTIMVKRAVATEPGDMIDVSREGISFSHGDEHWTHGTALESAPLLGREEAEFERVMTLEAGELFMMGDNPNSYDGRYYGKVNENQIVGTVLWAW